MKGSHSERKDVVFIVWLVELSFIRRDHPVEDAGVCVRLDNLYNSVINTRNLGTTNSKPYPRRRTQHPTSHGYTGRAHCEQDWLAPQ
jgi:hypothetical protein